MTDTTENEDFTAEVKARMKEEVAALTAVQRREYAKLIHEAEPPAPIDYANMSEGEFAAARRKFGG